MVGAQQISHFQPSSRGPSTSSARENQVKKWREIFCLINIFSTPSAFSLPLLLPPVLLLLLSLPVSSEMFSSSQFDGGFFASQSTQPTDSGPSPAKSRLSQKTLPVTVKQISQASRSLDDKTIYQIDGVDVTNVKLVGMISKKAERVTDFNFTLDDGTGTIGCRLWVNETIDRKQMEAIDDGMYVRLIGHLKSSQDKAQVVAFSLWPVNDFNEITHHFIECIHIHLQSKKLAGVSFGQNQMVESSQSTTVKSESNGFHSTPLNQSSVQISVDGLQATDQMILEYLQQASSLAQEKGVHRDEIARHLKLPVDKIMESITCLEGEGLIYSTIDEFHFKSTAS
ncbi:hypothetical protein Dimus_020274 [Dionaea muscipula]